MSWHVLEDLPFFNFQHKTVHNTPFFPPITPNGTLWVIQAEITIIAPI